MVRRSPTSSAVAVISHRAGRVQGQESEAIDLRHAPIGRHERHRDVRPHRADDVDHLDCQPRPRADVVLGRRVGKGDSRRGRGRHRHRHLDALARFGTAATAVGIGRHERHEGELARPMRLDLAAARHTDAAPRARQIDDRRVHHRAGLVPDGGGQRRLLPDRQRQPVRRDLERERAGLRLCLRRRRPRCGGQRHDPGEHCRRPSEICHGFLPHQPRGFHNDTTPDGCTVPSSASKQSRPPPRTCDANRVIVAPALANPATCTARPGCNILHTPARRRKCNYQ